jgi:hypothetical protein
VTTYTTICSPGFSLSCHAPLAATARWSAGMYRAADALLTAGIRRREDGIGAPGARRVTVNLDLQSTKQFPSNVPRPSQERSP